MRRQSDFTIANIAFRNVTNVTAHPRNCRAKARSITITAARRERCKEESIGCAGLSGFYRGTSMRRGFIDVDQESIHRDAIEELARVTHRPAQVVARVFEEQFTRLKSQARVKDYLVLFASRRTRELLSRGAA
jgi:hypothetical protein